MELELERKEAADPDSAELDQPLIWHIATILLPDGLVKTLVKRPYIGTPPKSAPSCS